MKHDGKKYYFNKVIPFINKLKNKTEKYIAKGRYDRAMDSLSVASCVLYETNQYLLDERLENFVTDIAEKFAFASDSKPEKKKVLFYDGFGLDNRGLAKIYLKCIAARYETVYCVPTKCKNRITESLKLLGKKNAVYFLDEKGYSDRIRDISKIIERENPSDIFIYVFPFDVAAITAFTAYGGKGERYFINLTDHAFWLGNNAYDKLIEFRDYGGYLSLTERKETENRIVKIPMYPDIKTDAGFSGFPFPFDEKKQKLFFSGGALYKTIGMDGRYYKLVCKLLKELPDSVFWYAGEGNDCGLKRLMSLFPERVYHTAERKDLFGILLKCTFYLSTYPICGNLMTQYAAAAGVVPLTLRNGNDGSGSLIGQEELNFEFDDEDSLIAEAKKLVEDDKYRESRGVELKNSVMKKEDFESAFINLIENGEKTFGIKTDFADDGFKEVYLDRVSFSVVADCVARKGRINILNYPVFYFGGCIIKIFRKLFKR